MSLFRKKETDSTNFWVSYADLMAGLLFVFILLIGAIVIKSMALKSSLHDKEESLSSTQSSLEEKLSVLELRDDEIKALKQILLDRKSQLDDYSKRIVVLQTDLVDTNNSLNKKSKSLKDYEGKVLVLSNRLTDANNSMSLKDEQLVALLSKLEDKETRYERLVSDLQKTKKRIKGLTGIKVKVIGTLKKALGKNVAIDPDSGSLKLASNILFATGEAELKEGSKEKLKQIFEEYIGTLVRKKEIRKHLDKIIIEGHTDSDGSYLYNLELSQMRAFTVMRYLLSLDFSKENHIKPLVVASGRSYLDIIKVNGKEDKEASRRIEIKFTLKNDNAMHEIEKILEDE